MTPHKIVIGVNKSQTYPMIPSGFVEMVPRFLGKIKMVEDGTSPASLKLLVLGSCDQKIINFKNKIHKNNFKKNLVELIFVL